MNLLVTLEENKELFVTKATKIYKYENNADNLILLLPSEKFHGKNLRDCLITLNIFYPDVAEESELDKKINADIKLIDFEEELYNDEYLISINPITLHHTSNIGDIKFYLEIMDASDSFLLRTGVGSFRVDDHYDVEKDLGEYEFSILHSCELRMQKMYIGCKKILDILYANSENIVIEPELKDELDKLAESIWEDENGLE